MTILNEIKKAALTTRDLLVGPQSSNKVYKKGDFNYVTAVDLSVQEALYEALMKIEGSAQFMGEENEAVIDWTRPAWVVDPVDGTTNLMHGYNLSAVSIALWDGKDIKYGVIYDPYRDEMFSAERGRGAHLNRNPIGASKTESITHSLIAVETAPYNKELAGETFGLYQKVFERCRDIRCSGSAALDFAHLACGRCDALFSRLLNPWDFAAGVLIVKEAGGVNTDWQGGEISLANKQTDVLSSNGLLQNGLLGLIKSSL